MTIAVSEAYDSMVELYASVNLDALKQDENARRWLEKFTALAAGQTGFVADLGCGPGHVTSYLAGLGLTVTGYDLSPGQIHKAQQTFPDQNFQIGDLTALSAARASLGGILSRYSLIHLDPSTLGAVFAEWARALEPEAPALVTFFGSLRPQDHGTAFDHKVTTAYELCPHMVGALMKDAGFSVVAVDTQPCHPSSPRPYDQATVLAQRS